MLKHFLKFILFKVNDELKITHEDQKMINDFANKNAKHNELKASIEKQKVNKRREFQKDVKIYSFDE